ncbi:cyanophycin synthetase [Stella humosa]|uniref:Cyanophycin synthetase n=1 Tax=Stella humosa TaxID=94 RepID=A0A3N1KP79_9PROT|nr:acetate--CoA ligase family protein [Stella humosa]ROP81157.1 cyanophycin synthetase [Stella humosa]BBK32503.1 cyanophycin synthetase [Stella humosa]
MTLAPPTLRIIHGRHFPGPSVYCLKPAYLAAVEMGRHGSEAITAHGERFFTHLAESLPECASAIDAARTVPAATIESLATAAVLELQRSVGAEVEWSAIHRHPAGHLELLVAFEEPQVVSAAMRLALVAIAAALNDEAGLPPTGNAARSRRAFTHAAEHFQLVHTTRYQIRAAERRGIPHARMFATAPVVLLGHGRRQRRIVAASNERTSNIGESIAGDKRYTSQLLASVGLPVPRQMSVGSVAEACAAAEAIGFPVVMKAARVDKGRAVILDLQSAEAVADAYRRLERFGHLLVEKHVEGEDHRLLVIGGRMVAASRRLSARVTGDGRHSIGELIEITNRDPRRGERDFYRPMVRIRADEEVTVQLAEQGLDLDAVPVAGRVVRLRANANLSTGGTGQDVTGIVHPDARRAAEVAARVIGLDIAGVDLMTTDISRSPAETGAAICEVNLSPGLGPHLTAPGSPDVLAAMLDHLFPDGGEGRIPLAAITGTGDRTTTARMAAAIMGQVHGDVGVATASGVEIDGQPVAAGDRTGPSGARMLLWDPVIAMAILEAPPAGIAARGLPFDRCHVGAIMGSGGGALARMDLPAPDSLIVRVATELAVLDATCPQAMALRRATPARRACFITSNPDNPLVGRDCPPGDLAATVAGNGAGAMLVLHVEQCAIPLLRVASLPSAGAGSTDIECALFAAAIAWGLGAGPRAIAAGLAAYASAA